MKEIINIASYYIKGKPVYPAGRRMLNLLFIISISSFVYEKIYSSYTWLDFSDYKGILNFFIKGQFFIPFSIFIVIYALTQFVSSVFFTAINHLKSVKLQRKIMEYQFKKDSIDEALQGIEIASKQVAPVNITPELIIKAYSELRSKITPEALESIEQDLQEPRRNLEANFILLVRAAIAITIFKFNIPQFGWLLYITTMICLFFGMVILIIGYRLLDIVPTLLKKFQMQAEEYLKVHIKVQSSNLETLE